MAQIVVSLERGDRDDENLIEDGERLSKAVDADLDAFGEYFQRELKNDEPLSKSERAIIKTYIWWKTHQEKHDAQQASSSEHV